MGGPRCAEEKRVCLTEAPQVAGLAEGFSNVVKEKKGGGGGPTTHTHTHTQHKLQWYSLSIFISKNN